VKGYERPDRNYIEKIVASVLDLSEPPRPDAPLPTVLVDSLQAVEVLILLEELAGHEVPMALLQQLNTFDDLVALAETYASRSG
jgi:acyl carrier protein